MFTYDMAMDETIEPRDAREDDDGADRGDDLDAEMARDAAPVAAEDACMHDGCCRLATQLEADDGWWHDWLWCDEHAAPRLSRCEPLITKKGA